MKALQPLDSHHFQAAQGWLEWGTPTTLVLSLGRGAASKHL
jgi:hypothetical protein